MLVPPTDVTAPHAPEIARPTMKAGLFGATSHIRLPTPKIKTGMMKVILRSKVLECFTPSCLKTTESQKARRGVPRNVIKATGLARALRYRRANNCLFYFRGWTGIVLRVPASPLGPIAIES